MADWINTKDNLPRHQKLVVITNGEKEIQARYCRICNVFATDKKEDLIYSEKWKNLEKQQ